jgi:hypothetical protein
MMADTFPARRFVGEGGHGDRDLVAADAGDFDRSWAWRPRPSAGWRKQQVCSFFSLCLSWWSSGSVQVFHLKLTGRDRALPYHLFSWVAVTIC